jgi:hypothetical protein
VIALAARLSPHPRGKAQIPQSRQDLNARVHTLFVGIPKSEDLKSCPWEDLDQIVVQMKIAGQRTDQVARSRG